MLKSRFRRLLVKILLAMDIKVVTICNITGYSKVTVYKIKKSK